MKQEEPTKGNEPFEPEILDVLERIRLLRNKKGISLRELVDRSGISKGELHYIESGQKAPTLSTLLKLARALDVEMKDFFIDSDDTKPQA